jgi:ATP-dependent helicase/nuclease subunit A
MRDLTHQQSQALDVRGASVALGAGAGCGKTTVLTARFVAALEGEGRLSLERIAALTFTDKAAGELRGRVRAACRDRLEEGDDPGYWRVVLRGLEAAPIGTFHTFCGEIVRRYAVRAGVDPGFAILDESIAATCREEAVDAALRNALIDLDLDLRDLAVYLGLDAVRNVLIDLLADRSADSIEAWSMQTPEGLVETWRNIFEAQVKPAILRRFRKMAEPCLEMIRTRRDGFPSKMADDLQAILDGVDAIDRAPDLALALAEIRGYAMMPRGITAAKWPDPELYEVCRETFVTLREKQIDKAIKFLEYDEDSTAESAEMGIKLARLATKALGEFAGVKHQRGALDFNDLLVKARDLLRDSSLPVRDELAAQFELILIDEFQDTDPVQDEIVRLIARDDPGGGRLFLVGDFKQSIYGFRGAVPEIFNRYRRDFPAEGRLPLTENFRSRPAILDFVNALFADAFTDTYEPLEPGRVDTLPDDLPAVVFAWPSDRDERPKGKPGVDADRRVEAARLARLVRGWIDEGRTVRDKETNRVRPMHAGDVAILFRANTAFIPFEQALADVDLDYYVVGGAAFYTQQEVQDVINVLAVLDDPHDSLSLAGALRSPFFALSDEALYWLATVVPGDLSAGLARSDEATLPDLSPRDRRLAARAFDLLGRWRGFKDREPIAGLVARVLDESGFEAALLGEPLGDRKRANARKIVRMARKYDAQGGFTLADFVSRLRADLKNPPREEQASTTDELGKAVRLMTVHKAKGLEFPFVILPDLDRRPGEGRSRVVLDPALGPLVNHVADDDDSEESAPSGSLGWLVNRQIRGEAEEAEALRVFYVAATRARDLLVLSVCGDPTSNPQSAAMKLLRERFDVIDGSCRAVLADGWRTPRVEMIFGAPPVIRTKKNPRRRPPLLAVSRLIESAMSNPYPPPQPSPTGGEGEFRRNRVTESSPSPPVGEGWGGGSPCGRIATPPRFLSLEPSTNRLDRLVRAILLDPRAFRRGVLEDVAAGLARRESPAAPPRLVSEAIERLGDRLAGIGREILAAKEVRRDLPWSITWPEASPDATVIVGRIDLAYRDAKGSWHLLHVADASAPRDRELLRMALSARVAPRLGLGTIARAWLLTHGPEGTLTGEDRFGDDDIASLLAPITTSGGSS